MTNHVHHPGGVRVVDHEGAAVRGQTEASISELHGVLSSERRRTALSIIAGASLPIGPATLARAVAAREDGVPLEAVPRASVDDVHLALYHVHLPRMADSGVIELDGDGAVEGIMDGFESSW